MTCADKSIHVRGPDNRMVQRAIDLHALRACLASPRCSEQAVSVYGPEPAPWFVVPVGSLVITIHEMLVGDVTKFILIYLVRRDQACPQSHNIHHKNTAFSPGSCS
eukprot:99992-Rhodomonas_salina.1